MRRLWLSSVTVVAFAAGISCRDTMPTAPVTPTLPARAEVAHCIGSQSTYQSIYEQLVVLYQPPGGVNISSAVSKLDEVQAAIDAQDWDAAKAAAHHLIKDISTKARTGQGLPGDDGNGVLLAQIYNSIACFADIAELVGEFGPQDQVFVIDDTDDNTLIFTDENSDPIGGVKIPQGAFENIILVAFRHITTSYDKGKGPLDTKLDQYPAFFDLITSWIGDFREDVAVGVCVFNPPEDDVDFVRVGHRSAGQGPFRILPDVDVSDWLTCDLTAQTLNSGTSNQFAMADIVALNPGSRGFGGASSTFSTFGGVNTKSGFGGAPGTFSPIDNAVVVGEQVTLPAGCASSPAGHWVTPACRPSAIVATPLWWDTNAPGGSTAGNVLEGVTIRFTVTGAGASIGAVPAGGDCTAAIPVASLEVVSGPTGQVEVCWQVGSATSEVKAEPKRPYTGDLYGLEDVEFDPASLEWTITPVTNLWSFDGFFRPVDNTQLNRVKAGASVPIKFSLGGDRGGETDVFGQTPVSKAVVCTSLNDISPTEVATETVSNSGLTFDVTSSQYTYVWKTDRKWTGCRTLTMTFNDGNGGTFEKTLNFTFTK